MRNCSTQITAASFADSHNLKKTITMLNNIHIIPFAASLSEDEQLTGVNPLETPGKPNEKPEIEPEKLPNEDPGIQPDTDPDKDDDDDDDDNDPFKEIEIGDDPDEERKKIPIMQWII